MAVIFLAAQAGLGWVMVRWEGNIGFGNRLSHKTTWRESTLGLGNQLCMATGCQTLVRHHVINLRHDVEIEVD
jgi:hypothetical protein